MPVGSTLSPMLVNLLLNLLSIKINDYCNRYKLSESTWVDDLAFSGKGAEKHINAIKKLINSQGYSISWHVKEIQRPGSAQEANGRNVTSSKVTITRLKRWKIATQIKLDPSSEVVRGLLADAVTDGSSSQLRQLNKLVSLS